MSLTDVPLKPFSAKSVSADSMIWICLSLYVVVIIFKRGHKVKQMFDLNKCLIKFFRKNLLQIKTIVCTVGIFLSLACNKQVEISVLQVKSFTEIKIGQRPFEKIDPAAQVYPVPDKVFKSPILSCFHQQRH